MLGAGITHCVGTRVLGDAAERTSTSRMHEHEGSAPVGSCSCSSFPPTLGSEATQHPAPSTNAEAEERSDMEPIVQVSLDLTSITDAMPVAEVAVRAGVDWLEAGTPLILGEGLHAVRALRAAFPEKPIVADLKTMDAGYLEAEMMFKAGATHVVVMGVAHPATIRNAVRAARDYGGKVMGDVMVHPDKPACARMMEALGVDYVIVHTGLD